jgi:hypothetical protein
MKQDFNNECRYNWGFWDGQTARNHNRQYRPAGLLNRSTGRHFDSQYQNGYEAGFYWNEQLPVNPYEEIKH